MKLLPWDYGIRNLSRSKVRTVLCVLSLSCRAKVLEPRAPRRVEEGMVPVFLRAGGGMDRWRILRYWGRWLGTSVAMRFDVKS